MRETEKDNEDKQNQPLLTYIMTEMFGSPHRSCRSTLSEGVETNSAHHISNLSIDHFLP